MEIFDTANYGVSILSVLTLVTGLLVLVAGLSAVVRERASRLSLLFLSLTITIAMWMLAFSAMYASRNAGVALFWARTAYLGIVFIPAAVYHLTGAIAGVERRLGRSLHYPWAWTLSAVFGTIILFTRTIVTGLEKYSWGYYPRYGPGSIPYFIFFLGVLALALRHSIYAYRVAQSDEERRRMGWFTVSFAVGYLSAIDYLPSFGIRILPVGFIALAIFIALIAYTIWRYHFSEISTGSAAGRLLETLGGNIIVTDLEFRIRMVSEPVCSLLGYGEDELLGEHLAVISKELAEPLDLGAGPLLFRDREFVWVAQDAETIDVSVDAATVDDRRGHVAGLIFRAVDITRRKQQEALAESDLRYRTLVDSLSEGLMLIRSDGVIDFVNPRMAAMAGVPSEELIGLAAAELYTEGDDAANGGRPCLRLRTHDGAPLWVEVGTAALLDAKGNVTGSIRVHTDVTRQRLADMALRESDARYRLMAEHATDMISRLTPDGRFVYVSPASVTMLGYKPEELIGTLATELMEPADLPELHTFRQALLHGVDSGSIKCSLRTTSGHSIRAETRCSPIRDSGTGRVLEIVAVTRDVTERERAADQLQHQAYHDLVTGLPNRLLLQDRVKIALARVRREVVQGVQSFAAILFIDLDHFKRINDTFGHDQGDVLLQSIAKRFQATLREEDTVARFGGDEFIVLLPLIRETSHAALVAQKILATLTTPLSVADAEIHVTASIGIAVFPSDGDSLEVLLSSADAAMYQAKEFTRNSFEFARGQAEDTPMSRAATETALYHATERNELLLHFQPIYQLSTQKFTAAEALIRWQHPERGLLQPGHFIPIAEQSTIIISIGEWVLRSACARLRQWQMSEATRDLRLSVNVSAIQLQDEGLVECVARCVKEGNIMARFLELEITETATLRNPERTGAILRDLSALGVTISIDDFGAGYTSLAYLRTFPIDRLKIDQSFVRDMTHDSANTAIVSAIIAMAHALHVPVVAEGVETREQLDALEALGCDEIQGYFLCRPKPLEEAMSIMLQPMGLPVSRD